MKLERWSKAVSRRVLRDWRADPQLLTIPLDRLHAALHPSKTGEPAKDLEPILHAILADGTNLGLSKMAGAPADS